MLRAYRTWSERFQCKYSPIRIYVQCVQGGREDGKIREFVRSSTDVKAVAYGWTNLALLAQDPQRVLMDEETDDTPYFIDDLNNPHYSFTVDEGSLDVKMSVIK